MRGMVLHEGTDGLRYFRLQIASSWFPDGSIDDYFGANVFGV